MEPGGGITLADRLTVVGTAVGWRTPCVAFPAGYQNAQLVVRCLSILGGTNLSVGLITSWDCDQALPLAVVPLAATGITTVDVRSGFGPHVALVLASPNAQCVISAWLTPKRS